MQRFPMARYSVIIATHDRPPLLARAIRSIKDQAFHDVTLIVVSDDRSAETYSVARAHLSNEDIYMERGGDPGPARSRTFALAVARSEYVIFLDDDDEFSANYLATAVSCTKTAADSVCFCNFYVANDGKDRAVASSAPPVPVAIGERDPRNVYVRNYIPNSCLIYPIAAVRGKAFDESLVLNEDWDFLLNAIQGRPLVHFPVFGPIIHKTDRSWGDRRGAVNDHLLPDNLRRIYKKWPAPTPALRAARQSLFASAGIPLAIDEF
jgi:glycosyltransferase involved in cell wall biosynthesis